MKGLSMAKIEFGLSMRRSDRIAEQAKAIESLGYDYATTGEHVFFHVPTANAFISLAVAAGVKNEGSTLTATIKRPCAIIF